MVDSGAWPYDPSSNYAWPPFPQIADGAWPNWPPPNNNNYYGWPGFAWNNGGKSGMGAGTIILVAVLVTGFSLMALLILRLWFCGCSQDDDARRRRIVDEVSGNERKLEFGLSKDVIESFQVVSYKALVMGRGGGENLSKENESEGESLACPVCLIDYVEEDKRIRVLPVCKHSFHSECIDMWLFSHTSCPVCRRELQSFPCIIPNTFNFSNNIVNVNSVINSNNSGASPAPAPNPNPTSPDHVVIQIPQEELR